MTENSRCPELGLTELGPGVFSHWLDGLDFSMQIVAADVPLFTYFLLGCK